MTEDGRIYRMAALCGRGLNLLWGWDRQDARLDADASSLSSVLSHPWRDETAPWMGHPH